MSEWVPTPLLWALVSPVLAPIGNTPCLTLVGSQTMRSYGILVFGVHAF